MVFSGLSTRVALQIDTIAVHCDVVDQQKVYPSGESTLFAFFLPTDVLLRSLRILLLLDAFGVPAWGMFLQCGSPTDFDGYFAALCPLLRVQAFSGFGSKAQTKRAFRVSLSTVGLRSSKGSVSFFPMG